MLLKEGKFGFGDFILDTDEGELLKDGGPVQLPPKALTLLSVLVINRGHIVEKQRLIDEVWGDTFVEEGNLAYTVSLLRKALDDDAGSPRFIENVPRRGYRFVGAVQEQNGAVEIRNGSAEEVGRSGSIDAKSGFPFEKKWIAATLLGVVLVATAYFTYEYSQRDDGRIESLVVLPFANVSGDKDSEFLSDGLAETLINNLTRIRQLRVIGRSSAFRLRGREGEPQAIGNELSVDSIVTGRVLQSGDNINIQVDLIRTEDGAQLWGKRYEGKVADLLSLEQTIVREVSQRLRLDPGEAQQPNVSRNYTDNSEAFQSYLRGRYYWNKRTVDGIKRALREFQDAIDKDPDYALGYVGIADCYLLMEQYAGIPAAEALPKVKAAAERALQLDPGVTEAHASLANYYFQSWEWDHAEAQFKRAIELNPNYATAHHWYQIHLRTTGRMEEALAEIKRAKELDPLSPVIQINLVSCYLMLRDIPNAEIEAKRLAEMDPKFSLSNDGLGRLFVLQQKYEEAVDAFRRDVEVERSSQSLSSLGLAYGLAGKRDEARTILNELVARHSKQQAVGQFVAMVHIGLGDHDSAFVWLENDVKTRSSWLIYIMSNTLADPLRDDPRYVDIKRRMGLPL